MHDFEIKPLYSKYLTEKKCYNHNLKPNNYVIPVNNASI